MGKGRILENAHGNQERWKYMFLKKINRLHSFRGKWSRDRCGHSITLRALLLLGVMGSSEGPGWWGAEPTAPQCCPGSESLAGETAQW